MQGDSFPIFTNLKFDGVPIAPELIDDLEISPASELLYSYSKGTLKYDETGKRWYIWPTQEETFSMKEGAHDVEVRVKFKNGDSSSVKGTILGDKIIVTPARSREVL
jgi:hypothetical protein